MATDSTLLSAGQTTVDADHGAADNDTDFGSVQLAAAKPAGTVPVQLPQGQQVVVIPVQPGQTIELPTDSPDGLLAKIGADGNLAIVVDGRTIILQGFVAANDQEPLTLVTNDGDIIDITEVIAGTLPDIALDIETAAGPAAGAQPGTAGGNDASGSGIFVPFAAGPLLGGFNAVGVLGATQLAYKLIDDERRFFVKEEESNDLPKTIVIIPEEGQPVAEDGAFLIDEDFLKDGNHDLPSPSPQDDAGSSSAAGFVVVDFGLDGPRAVDPILMDPIAGGNGTPSGLFTTDGTPILLHLDAAASGQQVLHGYLTAPGVDDAFVLTLDTTTGQFQLVLNESLQHDENSFEDNVTLEVVFSAFDATNDQQSATLHLNFDDDMPEITAGEGQFKLALDETTTTQPYLTDYDDPNFPDDGVQDGSAPENEILGKLPAALNNYGAILGAASANAAALFNVQFGADNEAPADGTVIEFTILESLTNLQDSETKEFITLVDKGNGLIEGQISGGVVVFALLMDASGQVTMAQYRAIDHGDEEGAPGAHDEVAALGAGFLAVTLTATDGDGDQATKTVDIGDGITFDDDGPVFYAWVLNSGGLDEEGFGGGIYGGPGDSQFNDLFATGQFLFNFGNDKDGFLSIADLTVRNSAGGSIDLTDLRTADGHDIVIDKSVDAGTGVITWVGVIQGGPNANTPAFTITLDGSGANIGDFTFTLQAPLEHPFTDGDGKNDGPETSYEDDLQFILTVSATDSDGDVAYAQPMLINIDDDGPKIDQNYSSSFLLAVDETVDGKGGGDVDANGVGFLDGTTPEGDEVLNAAALAAAGLDTLGTAIGAAVSSAADLFNGAAGADGEKSHSYDLDILNGGLTALIDTETGGLIQLIEEDGFVKGVVQGTGELVFALSIDDQTGDVTMAQYRAINHGPDDGSFPDEVKFLGSGLLQVTYSITDNDNDNDKVSSSVDIGAGIAFDDDGPVAYDDTDSVSEDGAIVATGNVITGLDGQNAGFGSDENGEDGVADTAGSDKLSSIQWSGAVNSEIEGTYGTLIVDADGNYRYELDNESDAVQQLKEGETKTETFTYTIIDGDGDEDQAKLTITITGKNDGPNIDFFPEDPEVKNGAAVVSDEGLPGGNPDSDPVPDDETDSKAANGTFKVSDPDAGDVLTVELLTTGLPALSFGGQLVNWVLDGPHTLRGQTGGTDAIVIQISTLDGFNYNYAVTLSKPLDHPDGTIEDEINFNVGVKVTDLLGASDTAQLNIEIEDDSPRVESGICGNFLLQVDETVNAQGAVDVDANGLNGTAQDGNAPEGDEFLNAAAVVTAGLNAFGTAIGAATSSVAGLFSGTPGADGEKSHSYDLEILNGGLTALIDTATGQQIQLVEEGGYVKGVVNGGATVVFAIYINDQTGAVTMAQYRAINHGTDQPISYPDEVLSLGTGLLQATYSITDKDNDTDSLSKDIGDAIKFDDDGPAAVNDKDSVTEDLAIVATGNVVSGLDGQNAGFGSDANLTDGNKDSTGSDSFGSISWKDAVAGIIDTTYGKLIVDADGNYKYELDNDSKAVQDLTEGQTKEEVFTYTILDKDGDASTATLTITITGKNDGPRIDLFPEDPNTDDRTAVVSDEGLAGGLKDSTGQPTDDTDSKVFVGNLTVSDPDVGDTLTVAMLDTGTFPVWSFGGNPVLWLLSPDGLTLTGTAGGNPAITVVIAPNGLNAYTYTVTQFQALDHPNAAIEDELQFNITVQVKDSTNATDTAILTVQVEDDSPVVVPGTTGAFVLAVDETVNAQGAVDVDANGTNGTAQDGSAPEGDEFLNAAAVTTASLAVLGTVIGAATSSAAGLFSGTPGADGEKSHSYDLQILNGGLTALRDTATGGLIQLVESGGFVMGVVQGSGELVFALHINEQTGLVTMAQYRAINHGTDAPNSYPDEVISLGGNLLQVTYTITDKDNDTGSLSKDIGAGITFDDDGPTVTASGSFSIAVDETVGGNGTDVDANGTNGTALDGSAIENDEVVNLAAVVAAGLSTTGLLGANTAGTSTLFTSNAGSDGEASKAYSFQITGGGNTGLVDTATGQAITLFVNGSTIEGRNTNGDVVFALAIDASTGLVTMAQYRAINHGTDNPNSYPDETATMLSGKLGVTLTVTDKDGDVASATQDISGGIKFDDDGPTVSASGSFSIAVDETLGGSGDVDANGTNGTQQDGSAIENDEVVNLAAVVAAGLSTTGLLGANTAGTSTLFTSNAGSDGEASKAYSFQITGGGNTGLVDTATGQAITLFVNGSMIEGRNTNGDVVFALAIDAATGLVTMAQYRAINHGTDAPNSYPDETATMLSGKLGVTLTVTDKDGDVASATQDISGGITFDDDGPTVSASGSFSIAVDETLGGSGDVDANGANGTQQDGSAIENDEVVNLAAVVAAGLSTTGLLGANTAGTSTLFTSNAGSDGQASKAYSFQITGGGTTGLVDTATGQAITLFVNGSTIEGRNTNGDVVFALAIDAATGVVTMAQYRAINHGSDAPNSYPDETATMLAGKLGVTLTVTDKDGDVASATQDISGGIVFDDDGPTVSASGSFSIAVDETVGGNGTDIDANGTNGTQQDGSAIENDEVVNLAAVVAAGLSTTGLLGANTAGTSTLFTSNAGSDGQASKVYSFQITGGGNTGLVDTATGQAITLFVNGSTIEGRNTNGDVVFVLAIDAASGLVTMAQYRAINHGTDAPNSYPDETATMLAGKLGVTLTVTDKDGDVASATQDISGGIKFDDDGPRYISPDTLHLENKGVIGTSDQVTANLNFVTGSDGVGNVVFNVAGVTAGVTSGITVKATDAAGHDLKVGGQQLYLYYGGVDGNDTTLLVAKTLTGTVGFTIDINPQTGQYVYNQEAVISNGTEVSATDLSGVGGGNVPFKLLINIGGTQEDVAMTTTNGASVNSDNDDIGISQGQTFESGEKIRFDLVNGLQFIDNPGNTPDQYAYDGTHNPTTRWKQLIQITGNASNNADFIVGAILSGGTQDLFGGSGDTVRDLAVTNINIYNALNQLVDPLNYAANGVTLTDMGNGIKIEGLKDDWSYEVVTDQAHNFSAVTVEAIAGTDTFSLGFFSYGQASAGTSADLSYNVVGTDGDGDATNGTIDISLYPDASSSSGTNFAGTAADDTFLGTQGVDTINGLGGHDRLAGNAGVDTINGGEGNDIIIGGSGNDILSGGNGSDTFVYETLVDGKDTISDFNIAAPGSGGDKLDISQVLDHPGNTWADGGTVADAVAGGFLTFTNSGGFVQVNVDIDGSAGNAAPTAVAVLTNLAFVSAAQAQTDLTDNIVAG